MPQTMGELAAGGAAVTFSEEGRAELIGALSRTADMVAGLLDALDVLRAGLEAGRQPTEGDLERLREDSALWRRQLEKLTALTADGVDDRAIEASAMSECHCHQGWICEEHPNKPWPHDACAGPGTRCDNADCPWSQHRPRPSALDTSDWQAVVSAERRPVARPAETLQ